MAQGPTTGSGALVYSLSTCKLTLNGETLAQGYSGAGPGKNNPDMQSSQGVGPIPEGKYTVGRQFNSTRTGPGAMRLTPIPGT